MRANDGHVDLKRAAVLFGCETWLECFCSVKYQQHFGVDDILLIIELIKNLHLQI